RCSDGHIGVLGVPSYLKISGTTVTGYTSKIPADLVIPDGVTGIGSSALSRCTNLESVTIPGSVTYIGKEAFDGCTNLTSVTIDDGATSIGESAFYNCENLTSVTIPASVTSIGWKAFLECTNLSEIQFNGTKEQWNAIEGRNIGIPGIRCSDGVIGVLGVPSYLSISGTKVSGHTDAIPSNVVIPDGVTEIGDYAFNRCKNLESVTIPASVTKISYNAFENCTNLTNVTIPSSVTSIGDKSFYMCNNLMNVIYTGTLADWCGIDWGYDILDLYANPLHHEKAILYINDSAVKDAVIPNGVTEIKKSAFYGYKNLTSVTIPVSVTSIGGNAFIGCTGLTKVIYTGTLADWCAIDWGSGFANPLYNENAILYINDSAVTDAKIPNNVTEIKKWAFCGYKNLTSVEIPSSVESIGKSAFSECTNLASIHYDGTQTEWENIERDTDDGLSDKTITGKNGITWIAQ
ncbi:MAG: leucine-rich repeat domain-containing protein, partial [Treponemataceae bacterium]|nr:leucine-rich repeat domain-containing protein [Treponemataceae bacterium]